ncbi:MAG: hypothetical protein AAF632_03540 [Bacteroidota bacterium]
MKRFRDHFPGLIALLTGCLVCFLQDLALAQATKFFRVDIGEVPVEVLPKEGHYHFADFRRGKVIFHNGQTATAKLNYNRLYQEMQFVDRRQDTLSIVDNPPVKEVVVNQARFYFHPQYGYLEEVERFENCTLAGSQRLQLVRDEDLGSSSSIDGFFGRSGAGNPIPPSTGLDRSLTEREFYRQPAAQPLTLALLTTYYFMDFNSHWHPARKSSLRRIFPGHQRSIEQFLRENKVNFNDAQDLIKLLHFGSQLE